MRIVFMGTPEYAVPSLRALVALAPRHEVVGVVTQPDRPKDRSREPQPPEVKTAALKLGLRPEQILQPESVNEAFALDALRALHPDLFCVVSFGGLLRHAALSIPWILPLNAHGSLLPRYRGAAPIQAALLAGDVETGVTIQKMVRKLDAGPILLKRSIPIGPTETAGSLHDRLAELSASCFVEALEILERGHPILEAQDEALATRVGKLTKESGTVDWSREAAYLGRFVRAMSPWPGAWTRIARRDGGLTRRLRICSAALSESVQPGDAVGVGRVVEDQRIKGCAQLGVRCGDGLVLAIATLQPEGGREMSVGEWIRGAGRAYVDGCRLG